MSGNVSGVLADGNPPGVRRAHHYPFQHGLASDEGFLGRAFQRGQKLQSKKRTQSTTQIFHFVRLSWLATQLRYKAPLRVLRGPLSYGILSYFTSNNTSNSDPPSPPAALQKGRF